MASSSSTVPQGSTLQPQADPLPTKRGEIGYRESLNPPVSFIPEQESDVAARHSSLPERHPADRDSPPATPEQGPSPIDNADSNQSAAQSQSSSRPTFSFFNPKFNKRGVRTSTILLLVAQISLLVGTIALWIIFAKLILPSSNIGKQMSTSVFVYVSFILGIVVQLVFLERLIFRYRAERYAMLHPGEAIPDLFNRGEQVSTRLALAPWNRPPLPTVSLVLRFP
jgi:hypothetical protein